MYIFKAQIKFTIQNLLSHPKDDHIVLMVVLITQTRSVYILGAGMKHAGKLRRKNYQLLKQEWYAFYIE